MGARNWTLDIGRKFLLVQKWTPNLTAGKINFKQIPLWFILRNIPMHLYNSTCLSYIASAIGRPLYMHRGTISQAHLYFARICAEVDFEDEQMQFVHVKMDNGQVLSIDIVLPWSPEKCLKCQPFGYNCERTEEPIRKENDKPVDAIIHILVMEEEVAIEKSHPHEPASPIDSDQQRGMKEIPSEKKQLPSPYGQEYEAESNSSDLDIPTMKLACLSKSSSSTSSKHSKKASSEND